ncbi:MAG: UDP-N-acetylglucosamine diphosphorylase/glucosamine-1-phosphate N-acetyltransferase [Nitrospiraceae bacterium]|jgi:bifunctional UDP-N-acetylglucosamine pyrophosphorylase / glucosamine-1-phosphate N-acetyltransferase|nr:MAG: UDP-N-acetylglucosamine diphosphorylase/glucosamine-1-phosphate N-acetyltransferase [Nitrospiraceae bacterium]
MNTTCVILAAGLGKRMNSSLPKVLHKTCGIPMLQSVIDTARKLKCGKIVVVTGRHGDLIEKTLATPDVTYVLQKEPKGTGHALLCAREALHGLHGVLLVLNGDTPLVNAETIKKFLKQHAGNKSGVSVLSFIAENPDDYGRIVRDASGQVLAIVEQKDADASQRGIREVNSGVYAINQDLLHLLDDIQINRKKGEYYLTDIIALSARKGIKTTALCVGIEREFMGVNTKQELYRASRIMEKSIIEKWIEKGVNILDAGSVFIHPHAVIGPETTLYPNVYIDGATRIGRGVTIYPNVRISQSRISDRAVIKDSTVIEESVVKAGATVGPFAHLRPGSEVGADAKIGNFVELKKAVIGTGAKASHLSYLGDARIGKGVNIGAGTITCNYDGRKKSLTVVEEGVFVGSDSQLVAPVRIGRGAYIGAGSTITKDVPPHALAVSRVEQRNIKDWAKKRRAQNEREAKAKRKENKAKR